MRARKAALFIAILATIAFCLGFAKAEARVFVGGGVILGGPHYYYPPYYAYYPPPYPPYPSYVDGPYLLPPATADDRYYSDNDGSYCREYNHTVVIDGERRQAYGHACREPDGSWHIVD